jgi:hypothetical protein
MAGGGATRLALLCVDRFFSRPESGADDDFVRVVGDKGKGKKENRRQRN